MTITTKRLNQQAQNNELNKTKPPVRYSPAFMASAYGSLPRTDTGFSSNGNALLDELSVIPGLRVDHWYPEYEIVTGCGNKILEEQRFEIHFKDKQIIVSFICKFPSNDDSDYHIVSNVIGEGFIHQCRCVNGWVNWFNSQFQYLKVTAPETS
ncbi:MAG: hypothetical protein WC716_06850 [Chitinophagaceae bacterium]|jgi:hypothetical protein